MLRGYWLKLGLHSLRVSAEESRTDTAALLHAARSLRTSSAAQQQQPATPPEQQQGRPETSQDGASSQPPAGQQKAGMTVGKLSQEELWFAAVAGKVNNWAKGKHPQLKGKAEAVAGEVRERYFRLLERHATGRVMDEQARRQLKAACLAAASYPVVLERTGSPAAAEELIQQGMGGAVSSMFVSASSATTWIKTRLLGRAPAELALQALSDISTDMAHSCDASVQVADDKSSAQLKVTRCLSKDVFSAEGLPAQLLGYQCCQANMMWLDVYKGYGISSSLSSSMARGDSSCCIQLLLPKAK